MTTIGENEFERFCTNNSFISHKISEEEMKTPDYEFYVEKTRIIVEIKDLESNQEEKAAERHMNEHNWAVWGRQSPGTRIRYKIEDAKKQLKNLVTNNEPTILILFDTRPVGIRGIYPYEMKVAMYGTETYHLAVPKDYSRPVRQTGLKKTSLGSGLHITQNGNL